MRLPRGSAAGIVNRNGVAGPVDEQLLAGLVFLPKHHFLFAPPALVQFAEARVAIAVGLRLAILFPKQRQR